MFRPRIVAQFIICHDGCVGTLSNGWQWAAQAGVPQKRATTILEQTTSTEEVEAAKEAFNERNGGRML
jgi:hypothetical protein